jgi:hypothetical protein
VQAGVGDTTGMTRLYMPVNDTVHSPSIFFSDPDFIPLQIPILSLDSYQPLSHGRPSQLIKIDTEGYEPNIIRGMQALIKRGMVKNIFCEFNSGWLKRNAATTPKQLFDLIISYGFIVHKKSTLSTGPDPDGSTFECQDIWFKWPN